MLVENNHCCELLLRDAKFCYRSRGRSEDLQLLLPSGLRGTCGSRNGTSSMGAPPEGDEKQAVWTLPELPQTHLSHCG